AIKQKQQSLSLEAHDYANAIPDLSNMIKAVQGLVAQCEDLKLKCYEEMDKRKKLYNIVQETKGRTMHANSTLAASLLPDRVWPVFLRFPKISSDLSSHRRRCSHGRHWHRRGREGKKRSDQTQGWRAQQEVGVEAIKQKQQSLSLEAHDCANAIPDLSNMIKAVQGLVAQCEDLKLKCYEEMDKRKKLYNIVQETKGIYQVFLSMPTLKQSVVSISVYLHLVGKLQPHCNKVYKRFAMRKNKFMGSNK
ncbi:hypothetical protein ACJX0J_018102, partial [Zea mays]